MIEIGQPGQTSKEIFEEYRNLLNSINRLDFGVPYLDDALCGMFPGDVTLVGARSGGGKTEFACQVLLEQHNPNKRNRPIVYYALDHDEGEIEKRLFWRALVDNAKKMRLPITIGRRLRYADWRAGRYDDAFGELERDVRLHHEHLFSHCETRFVYKKGVLSGEEIAQQIASAQTYGFQLAIVDHFHALRTDGDEFKAQSRAIRKIVEAAEKSQISVLILGQFRKASMSSKSPIPTMEEFSGHSDLRYQCKNVIVLAPRYTENVGSWETYFHVDKARFASDSKAFVGCHSFDIERNRYSTKYQVFRHKPFSEPEPLSPEQVPQWAVNAHSFNNPELKGRYGY